jgi:hypothetical protein
MVGFQKCLNLGSICINNYIVEKKLALTLSGSTTLNLMTLSIVTSSITAFSMVIKCDTQHNNAENNSIVVMLCVFYAECRK